MTSHPFDQQVLELIERSPNGSVPHIPTYDEAIARLLASRQIFPSADHKDGYVTAQALARLPLFHAAGLEILGGSAPDSSALESNNAIFDRYLASLPDASRKRAETFRLRVAGHPVHHRHKADGQVIRDPLNTIFLMPGGGPKTGLPGNYLHGVLKEQQDPALGPVWKIQVMDSDNDAAVLLSSSLTEALASLQDLFASAPFHIAELEALGFEQR